MFVTLFDLAGLAIVGWALLIVLPAWRVTRWLADRAVFPLALSLIYAAGIVVVLARTGPGIMADFGTAEGVVGLLATADVALIAWIHILAFDHFLGVLIYRDNMQHRVVPIPVQSVILFLTLMFGPLGVLVYYGVRVASRGAVFAPAPAAPARAAMAAGAGHD